MKTLAQTRGDTVGYNFTRVASDGSVITAKPDEIYFTVKESYKTPNFILQKTMSDMLQAEDGKWSFVLQSYDTDCLPYGTYVYDIEIVKDGAVITIAKGKFILTEESTWAINEEK